MDLTKDIQPVAALTRGAADLISRAAERRNPIVHHAERQTHRRSSGRRVLRASRSALHLLKLLAQGDRDHDAGRVHDTAAVDTAIRDRLAAHQQAVSRRFSIVGIDTAGCSTPMYHA